jgi:hypothetical protein
MKLTKLFKYMTDLTKPEIVTFIRRGGDKLEVSCTDGVTHVKALMTMENLDTLWPHRGTVSVQTQPLKNALRDDAMMAVDGSLFSVYGPRWKVQLPCDVLDSELAAGVKALPGDGLVPPDFLNVNTTDAFGADVWVAFSRRKSGGVVGLISDYVNTFIYGQEVSERGTFPAKMLPATKGLMNIRLRSNDDMFSITGEFQATAVTKIPVTVSMAMPPVDFPVLSELLDNTRAITGNSFSVQATDLRDVVTAVTKLMPEETTSLRLRYKKNPQAPNNSALSVTVSNVNGVFSETIQATTEHDGDVLLHTKMFATALKGISLSKHAVAKITHNADNLRIDITDEVGKGKDKTYEKLATVVMVAGDSVRE